MAEEIGEAMN